MKALQETDLFEGPRRETWVTDGILRERRGAFLVVLKVAALLHKLSWGGRLCGKIPTLLKVSFPDDCVFAVGASWQRDALHESCWEASD